MKNTNHLFQLLSKVLVLTFMLAMLVAPIATYAEPTSTDVSQIANTLNTELAEAQAGVTTTANILFTIALVGVLIGLSLTRNPNKVAILLKVGGTILGCSLFLYLIANDKIFPNDIHDSFTVLSKIRVMIGTVKGGIPK